MSVSCGSRAITRSLTKTLSSLLNLKSLLTQRRKDLTDCFRAVVSGAYRIWAGSGVWTVSMSMYKDWTEQVEQGAPRSTIFPRELRLVDGDDDRSPNCCGRRTGWMTTAERDGQWVRVQKFKVLPCAESSEHVGVLWTEKFPDVVCGVVEVGAQRGVLWQVVELLHCKTNSQFQVRTAMWQKPSKIWQHDEVTRMTS